MATLPTALALELRPVTPRTRLRALIEASWTTQAIAAAVQLGLPGMLIDGPQSVQALAQQTSCHTPSLLRLLRALASIEIVAQREGGRIELTDTGRLLSADAPGSLAAWAEYCGTSSWAAWGQLRECVQTGRSVRRQSGAGGFDHLENNAQAALLFNRAMVELSRPVAEAIASEVNFAGVNSVVDVGGGFGELLIAVLCAHPHMRGHLFDMAHAIDAAHSRLADAGVAERCQLVAGSFFDAVPAGADAYLLKSVLHDWDDDRCVTILTKCAQAMSSNSRLLIVERLMPEHMSVSTYDQGIARGDLNMLVAQDGQERTLENYRDLLLVAGLRLMEPLTLSVGFTVLTAAKP